MDLMEYLHTNEEIQQLRESWRTKFVDPFPGFNFDEYKGIEDYKTMIKKALEEDNPEQAHRKIKKWNTVCKGK